MGHRRQAAENALRQHAYREAADHARRALALLATLPDPRAHRQEEIALQVTLGSALAPTQGFAGTEVARIYARARELCDGAGDDVQLLPVLLVLGRFHHIRGEVGIAREVGARLLAMAEATRDPAVRLAALNALGIMDFYAGRFDAALAHLDEGIRLYDTAQHGPARSPVFRIGQDPGVSCGVYAAWALQLLGYPDRAAASMGEAVALARSLAHPFNLAYACHFAAAFHDSRGECAAARALEAQAGALSTEHGFNLFLIAGGIHEGRVLCEQGRGDEGIARIRERLAAWRAIGAELRRPAFAALLADACGRAGRPADGLDAVSEGLAVGARTGQRYWDAELHRLRGALVWQSGDARMAESDATGSGASGARREIGARDAEAAFVEAVETASRQSAKWLELRAVTDLCRLWAAQGRRAAARARLAEIHGWFTEGFDTADVRAAASLLAELSRRQ
jgi:predicted ATPase